MHDPDASIRLLYPITGYPVKVVSIRTRKRNYFLGQCYHQEYANVIFKGLVLQTKFIGLQFIYLLLYKVLPNFV